MKGGNINYKNDGDAVYAGGFLTVHNPLFYCNGVMGTFGNLHYRETCSS